jgi:AraC-like DNA-binding protein
MQNVSYLTDQALQLRFFEAGSGAAPTGSVHEKKVPFTIIAQAVSGSYEVVSDSGHIRTSDQEAFLSSPHTALRITHHAASGHAEMRYRFVHLQFTIYETIDIFSLFNLPLKTNKESGKQLREWIDEAQLLNSQKLQLPLQYIAKRKELAYRFLNYLLSISEPNERYHHYFVNIQELIPVLSYIQSHLYAPISIEKLLSLIPVSRTALFQLFRLTFQQTPMHYIKSIRLQEAYKRLCVTPDSISQIAEQCGFLTQNHFCREFKDKYDMTPSEARKANQRYINSE